MSETIYTPTEYLPESHPHQCDCGTWHHEDADCRYSLWYPCPECDKAPTDWVKVNEEHWPEEVRR